MSFRITSTLVALLSCTMLFAGCWWDKPEVGSEEISTGDPDSTTTTVAITEQSNEDSGEEAPRAALYTTFDAEGPYVDDAEFDFPYWIELANAKIARTLRVPRSVKGRFTCKVYFQVDRRGDIVAIRVEQPSHSTAFDRACVEAIKFAQPFPPLPAEYQSDKIGLTVPLRSY